MHFRQFEDARALDFLPGVFGRWPHVCRDNLAHRQFDWIFRGYFVGQNNDSGFSPFREFDELMFTLIGQEIPENPASKTSRANKTASRTEEPAEAKPGHRQAPVERRLVARVAGITLLPQRNVNGPSDFVTLDQMDLQQSAERQRAQLGGDGL